MRYHPEIDSGPKLKTEPVRLNMFDFPLELPEQQCYTSDWKCVNFYTKITLRIVKPVHFLVYVQDPINSTLLLCATLIRDAAARFPFDQMFDNKNILQEALRVIN